MTDPAPIDLSVRQRVFGTVSRYPGLHLREIMRRVGTSSALAEYHLNVLEKHGLVTSTDDRGYRRFYPARSPRTPLSRDDKRFLGLARHPVALGIVLYLLERGRASHKDLTDVVTVTKSTVTYHLKTLQDASVVVRNLEDRTFSLADAHRARQLLAAYGPTPDLVEEYGRMWEEIFRGSRPDEPNRED